MAVYTAVSRSDLLAWLRNFDVGDLIDFEAIAQGIENTNYFVTTRQGRFVLTLFERLPAAQLPFYLGLMRHLARRGVACPDPVSDRNGAMLGSLLGKPAALVTRLAGRASTSPTAAQCAAVGGLLARMHLEARDYPETLPNPRGLAWWRETVPQVAPHLSAAQLELLQDELAHQEAFAASGGAGALPVGAVHADLFRDNVLFDDERIGDERIGGVVDFYFAGIDSWLYDLAVAANDWCIVDASGEFERPRLDALLGAYRRMRPVSPAESRAWPTMLRASALRFWLSRLHDLHLPRPAELVSPKDPAHFERILRRRRLQDLEFA